MKPNVLALPLGLCGAIPDLEGAVSGGGDGAATVRRHLHGLDEAGVAFEGLQGISWTAVARTSISAPNGGS